MDEVVRYARNDLGLNVECLHLKESFGIENAANQGILNSDSELIHIHDDDDSIADGFYGAVVDKFEVLGPHFQGVVVDTRTIEEQVSSNDIKFIKSYISHKAIDGVHLADILQKNRFPPISLIYKKSAFEKIGPYDINLPVLGDWDFNIRLLMSGDLAYISMPLANYHIRLSSDGMQAQTITSGDGRHDLYSAVVRNKYARNSGDAKLFLALAMTVGRQVQKVQSDVIEMSNMQKAAWTLKKLLKKVLVHR